MEEAKKWGSGQDDSLSKRAEGRTPPTADGALVLRAAEIAALLRHFDLELPAIRNKTRPELQFQLQEEEGDRHPRSDRMQTGDTAISVQFRTSHRGTGAGGPR